MLFRPLTVGKVKTPEDAKFVEIFPELVPLTKFPIGLQEDPLVLNSHNWFVKPVVVLWAASEIDKFIKPPIENLKTALLPLAFELTSTNAAGDDVFVEKPLLAFVEVPDAALISRVVLVAATQFEEPKLPSK